MLYICLNKKEQNQNLKKMKTKIDFSLYGVQFKNIEVYGFGEGATGQATGRGISAMARQYVAAKYGVKCQVHYDSFSMGNSLSIYVDPRDLYTDYKQIISEDLKASFCYGSFDAMTDCYDLKEEGKDIEKMVGFFFKAKYVSFQFGAKYGTKLYEELEAEGLN